MADNNKNWIKKLLKFHDADCQVIWNSIRLFKSIGSPENKQRETYSLEFLALFYCYAIS